MAGRIEESGYHIEDLKGAEKLCKEILELCPQRSSSRVEFLLSTCTTFRLLATFDHPTNVKDPHATEYYLDEAVRYSKEAVQLSSATDNWDEWFEYAMCLALRFKQSKKLSDRQTALDIYKETLNSKEYGVHMQILAANWAARTLFPDDVKTASCMFSQAVELLPKAISRNITQIEQQVILSRAVRFASAAATLKMQSNKKASEAVRLLEVERGVIAGLYIIERTESAHLEEVHMELAKKV
ncbi:hypothetical protein F5B19DRAFT_405660 [Rostrohypoxylon terebratum]|nr:hypothetical protein F5B19DRAFT_405660 [Rostrohypoxylon terebratum]